jgi:uncharacterized metal-binding protein YceD (DUF177 family)
MKPLQEFVIPLKGMKSGLHHHEFDIDGTFFAHYADSELRKCDVKIDIEMDRRPNMVLMQFTISGTIDTQCDRCQADIKLPISGEFPLIEKFGESEQDFAEEADVVVIHPDASVLNVAEHIYDFINLSIPISKVYDCENEEELPCDQVAKDILSGELNSEDDTDDPEDPFWEELKRKLG